MLAVAYRPPNEPDDRLDLSYYDAFAIDSDGTVSYLSDSGEAALCRLEDGRWSTCYSEPRGVDLGAELFLLSRSDSKDLRAHLGAKGASGPGLRLFLDPNRDGALSAWKTTGLHVAYVEDGQWVWRGDRRARSQRLIVAHPDARLPSLLAGRPGPRSRLSPLAAERVPALPLAAPPRRGG